MMAEYIAAYIAITIMALWLDRKRQLASPIKLFIFCYLIYYGIGTPLYEQMFPRQHMDSNYAYVLIGYFSCLVGMLLRNTRKEFKEISFEGIGIGKGYTILILSLIGTFAFTGVWIWQVGEIPIFSEDIEYTRTVKAEGTYYARQMTTLAVPVYFMMLAVVLKRKKSFIPIGLTAVILILCISIQGYRTFFISIIAISAMIAYRVRKDLFNTAYIGISMALMFFLSVFYGYNRYLSGNSRLKDVLDIYEYTAQNFFIRTTSLQKIVEYFPSSEPYQYGYFYLRGFGFLIPGKQIGPGMWLKQEVFNIEFAGDGFNPGILGEFYLNFGVAGVALGMVLYGWMISSSYQMYACGKTPGKMVFGACAYFYILLAMAPGLATTIASLVWWGVLIFFFQLMFRVKVR